MDRGMEGYISPPLFVSLGVLVIRAPPWSLQLQIALPPLPPAVCLAKSAHDVSLSQLWVEIHRINRFVRETHAWDCLHAVKLVHPLVRPILPQAMKKTTCTPVYSRCIRWLINTQRYANIQADVHICKQTNTQLHRHKDTDRLCLSLYLSICLSCLPVCTYLCLSVCVLLHQSSWSAGAGWTSLPM